MVVIANAGSDVTKAFADLPTSVPLTGAASGGSGTYTQWQWYILDKPDGSSAALSDPAIQSPTLNSVDTWGNYLLFLTVKDDLNEWSEQDPLLAPDSALVHVRVEGNLTDVQKPASGERNYSRVLHEWAAALEQAAIDLAAQTIASHSDTTATGAQLNELVGGGATTLHTHAGTTTPATTTELGLVKLVNTPLSVEGEPFVVTRDLFNIDAHIDGTMGTSGWQPGVIDVPGSGDFSSAHIAWYIPYALILEDWRVAMLDSGTANDSYEFKLYEMTTAQFLADDFAGATVIDTMTFSTDPSTDSKPRVQSKTAAHQMAADRVLAFRVTDAPSPKKGGGLSLFIEAYIQY